MKSTNEANPGPGKIAAIISGALVAGTLDGLAAVIILAKGKAAGVFMYIASAVYGPAAFEGGTQMIVFGVLFHYLIALIWMLIYFFLYPVITLLHNRLWLASPLYGIIIWLVMNRVVLPQTQAGVPAPDLGQMLLNTAILSICVALPVAYFTKRYYKSKST